MKLWAKILALAAVVAAGVAAVLGVVFRKRGAAVAAAATDPLDAGLLKPATVEGGGLHWRRDRMPVIVLYDTSVISWAVSIEAACRWWCARAGVPVFAFRGEVPNAKVAIAVAEGRVPGTIIFTARDGVGAATKLKFHEVTGEIGSAPVQLGHDTPVELRERVAAHELGHVLGLAHDAPEASVMFKEALPTPYVLTPPDAALLQKWYG